MSEESVDYRKCSYDRDVISQVEWNDEAPSIFINLMWRDIEAEKRGKPSQSSQPRNFFNCYNSASLREWLRDKNNVFAKWEPKFQQEMTDSGHGGAPDLNGPRYIRLYTPNQTVFLEVNDELKNIANGNVDFMIFDATYVGKIRLGDPSGHFYISGLHGQSPGEDVYLLGKGKPTKGNSRYVPLDLNENTAVTATTAATTTTNNSLLINLDDYDDEDEGYEDDN